MPDGDARGRPGRHHRTTTRAQHAAGVHLVERLLDVVERDLLGDERVQVEPALPVELGQHREVAVGQAVAVPAGLERAAAAEDVEQRQLGSFMSGVGTPTSTTVPARSRA